MQSFASPRRDACIDTCANSAPELVFVNFAGSPRKPLRDEKNKEAITRCGCALLSPARNDVCWHLASRILLPPPRLHDVCIDTFANAMPEVLFFEVGRSSSGDLHLFARAGVETQGTHGA